MVVLPNLQPIPLLSTVLFHGIVILDILAHLPTLHIYGKTSLIMSNSVTFALWKTLFETSDVLQGYSLQQFPVARNYYDLGI